MQGKVNKVKSADVLVPSEPSADAHIIRISIVLCFDRFFGRDTMCDEPLMVRVGFEPIIDKSVTKLTLKI